jgi:hypothetical protein
MAPIDTITKINQSKIKKKKNFSGVIEFIGLILKKIKKNFFSYCT